MCKCIFAYIWIIYVLSYVTHMENCLLFVAGIVGLKELGNSLWYSACDF